MAAVSIMWSLLRAVTHALLLIAVYAERSISPSSIDASLNPD
jgi:hypothetical protein